MHSSGDSIEEPGSPLNISSQRLLWLSLLSFVVYLLTAFVLFHFFHESAYYKTFDHGYSITVQLLTGAAAGMFGAMVIGIVIKFPPVSDVLDDFYIVKVLSRSRLTAFDRTQLSVFAGVGEEFLFRGAIQPLIGIWLTSVIFVGLHGYFKFSSPGHLVFSGMMFALSVGLGYLFEHAGLIAAMSAHAVYDMLMLHLVQHEH